MASQPRTISGKGIAMTLMTMMAMIVTIIAIKINWWKQLRVFLSIAWALTTTKTMMTMMIERWTQTSLTRVTVPAVWPDWFEAHRGWIVLAKGDHDCWSAVAGIRVGEWTVALWWILVHKTTTNKTEAVEKWRERRRGDEETEEKAQSLLRPSDTVYRWYPEVLRNRSRGSEDGQKMWMNFWASFSRAVLVLHWMTSVVMV